MTNPRNPKLTAHSSIPLRNTFSLVLFLSLLATTSHAQLIASRPNAVDSADARGGKTTASRTRSARDNFRISGSLTESYDSNILDYSDADRQEFDTLSTASQRFAIRSIDDNVTELGLRATLETGRRKSTLWRLRLKGNATLFGKNSYRNYSQWGFELRKNIRKSYVEFSVAWLPHFNLRNLYWRPMPSRPIGVRYTAADFHRIGFGFEVGTSFSKSLDGRFDFTAGSSDYHFPFDERDSRFTGESVRLSYDLTGRINTYLGAGLTQVTAAGKDSANALVKDVSNNQTLVEAGLRVKCDHEGRIMLSAGIDYQHQKYLSKKPQDSGHYQRSDNETHLATGLSWRVTDYLQPELQYEYRRSTSSVTTGVSEFGAFTGYRLGLQLTAFF